MFSIPVLLGVQMMIMTAIQNLYFNITMIIIIMEMRMTIMITMIILIEREIDR